MSFASDQFSGAATEQSALKGFITHNACFLTASGTYYTVNESNVWWIWPPPATVQNYPSITDDTSYRAFILESYIIDVLERKRKSLYPPPNLTLSQYNSANPISKGGCSREAMFCGRNHLNGLAIGYCTVSAR